MLLDNFDLKILNLLQQASTLAVQKVGERVGLSHTPCWRRIRRLEEAGIRGRVALLKRRLLNVGMTVFIQVKTPTHRIGWIEEFQGDFAGMGSNQMLAGDPETGEIRRFLTGPKGSEVTGLTWSSDRRTMFVGIQHPGRPFPDGEGSLPRSSIVAVKRDDNDLVG